MTTQTSTREDTFTSLSVIIIARNEAKNIARAIESVLQAVEHWPQTEILLVDSASSDETVEIAKRYPINIVRLSSSWFLSVAAGRHIGMAYTRGELVLHMDGDMELDPEWVDRSVAYAQKHPEVAAVGGYRHDVYMKDGRIINEEDQLRDPQDRVLEFEFVGGASLYRRSAIKKVGGFQPYIRGEEEVILCLGLRQAGYKVIQLPYLMSRHYCIPPHSLAGSLRRIRLDMWIGYGQVPRYYWRTSLFWIYLKERGGAFMPYILGVLISFIAFLVTIFSDNIIFFGSWMLIVAGLFLVFVIKKRSLRKTLVSLIARTGIAYSAVCGFLMPPRSPSEYPTDAEIIQVFYQRGGLCVSEASSANMIKNPEQVHKA